MPAPQERRASKGFEYSASGTPFLKTSFDVWPLASSSTVGDPWFAFDIRATHAQEVVHAWKTHIGQSDASILTGAEISLRLRPEHRTDRQRGVTTVFVDVSQLVADIGQAIPVATASRWVWNSRVHPAGLEISADPRISVRLTLRLSHSPDLTQPSEDTVYDFERGTLVAGRKNRQFRLAFCGIPHQSLRQPFAQNQFSTSLFLLPPPEAMGFSPARAVEVDNLIFRMQSEYSTVEEKPVRNH